MPKLTCNSQFTGIGPGTFMDTGPRDHHFFNFAGLLLGCTNGLPDNAEALVVDNIEHDYSLPLYTGDLMMVQLTTNASSTVAQLSDLTHGHAFVVTNSGRGGQADSELVGEDAVLDSSTNTQTPVPNFGTITFRSVSIGASPLGALTPAAYNMQTAAKVLQIKTGPLLGTAKDSFQSIFTHG